MFTFIGSKHYISQQDNVYQLVMLFYNNLAEYNVHFYQYYCISEYYCLYL